MPGTTRTKTRAKTTGSATARSSRLRAYNAKRNLRASGEPGGDGNVGSSAEPRFVIQKHDATRLHYDLRLEMEGVYRSWAVPKGLPAKPGEKVLAVEVEDHPLDYGTFEGTIPSGNYGAGTVMLWDRGHYSVEGASPEAAYRSGKIHFTLAGEKCHGAWTLVRMRRSRDDKPNWLVIKNTDPRDGSPFRAKALDRSVKTGRSMEQIAGGRAAPKEKKSAPVKKPSRARARAAVAESKSGRAVSSPPHYIEPMKALGVPAIEGEDWQLEIKYDGFRAIAIVADGQVELWSRNEKPLTGAFPEVADGLSQLPCRNAMLDGEIVAVDAEGRPSFQLLQGIGSGASRPPILYYVFDLLHWNGRSYLEEPIETRREALEEFLKRTPDCVRVSPVFDQPPDVLLEEVRRRGLEGIVAKRRGSVYEPGARSGAWVKHRVVQGQEFVIGGYTPPKGGRQHFGALLVGYFDGRELRYAGKVGAGFNSELLASLHAKFRRLESAKTPFVDAPRSAGAREATWLKPQLVAQVKFSEWTRDGLLRQPVFLGLRDDKAAREVVREAAAR